MGSTKKPSSSVLEAWGARWGQANAALVPVFVFSLTADSDRLLYRVDASRSKVRSLFMKEHTEYVALDVNSSKSGWPTMYETLQVVLLHVFNITFYELLNFVIHMML